RFVFVDDFVFVGVVFDVLVPRRHVTHLDDGSWHGVDRRVRAASSAAVETAFDDDDAVAELHVPVAFRSAGDHAAGEPGSLFVAVGIHANGDGVGGGAVGAVLGHGEGANLGFFADVEFPCF